MTYPIHHIAQIISAEVIHSHVTQEIHHLLYDSRRVWFPEHSLFFALKGKKTDGYEYIPELHDKGVRAFVVPASTRIDFTLYPDAAFLVVHDVLASMQSLVAFHRAAFHIPVIGLTGSNGKTIIKEWLFQSFSGNERVLRSPGSYNSQLGVPLSVWPMNATHTLGIFEAGISKRGEMASLEQIIKPTIGVLTYMGEAHSEGFTSYEEKIREKLSLFTNADLLIYCADDEKVCKEVDEFYSNHKKINCFSWGKSKKALFRLLSEEKSKRQTELHISTGGSLFSVKIPFTDTASVYNAMTCMALLWKMDWKVAELQYAVSTWQPVAMRLEQRQAIQQCSLINDSYSADLSSLRTALDFLSQQDAYTKRTLILTDMEETGMEPEVWVAKIIEMLKGFRLYRFIGIGPVLQSNQKAFEKITPAVFYENTRSFLEKISSLGFHKEAILLKGSRSFMLEKAVKWLEQKSHDTVLEINLTALRNNLSTYRKMIPEGLKFMVMVKAFGYGTGGHEIAAVLKQEGADYLAVAFADEGVELRKAGVALPILVLNPNEESFDAIIDNNLEPEIFSFYGLHAWNNYLQSKGITDYPVHIKLDTGMHRLGFMKDDMVILTSVLAQQNTIRVKSVFSHLAASEDPHHDEYTEVQLKLFEQMAEDLERAIHYKVIKHLANTAAISRHPNAKMDMVRLGIGLYGIDASVTDLQPVATLKTRIAQIKHLKKGDTVGYGRAGKLHRDSVIATVRIGYADGFPRILSNGKGMMMVNGKKVPVIGNVCMDMTMLDITDVSASEGDEVIVFGKGLSISQMAASAQTIPYEILTGIDRRVNRIYIQD